MQEQQNRRPSVPSSSGVHVYGSGSVNKGAEGAKNLWVRTGCHWDLNICMYNARSLSSDDRMIELEEEIFEGSIGVLSGLSEVCRKGKGSIILNNMGHTVYYSGSDEQRHGVNFVVNKNIAHNVISFRGLSDRVAELTVRINKRYQLKCVQVYLPTTSYPDEEIEKVYEEIDNIIINSKAHYNIVMGDFNAKVGPGEIRGNMHRLIWYRHKKQERRYASEFAERHKFKIMNTFFKKRLNRRWTWISPNGATKNEIDYIMTDSPDIFLDVSVINSLNTGSDHRMIRGKARIDTKFERAKMVTQPKKGRYR